LNSCISHSLLIVCSPKQRTPCAMSDQYTLLAQPSVAAAVSASRSVPAVILQSSTHSINPGKALSVLSNAACNLPPTKRKRRTRRKRSKIHNDNKNNSPARESGADIVAQHPPSQLSSPAPQQPFLSPSQPLIDPIFLKPRNRDVRWIPRNMIPNGSVSRSIPPHLRKRALQLVPVQAQAASAEAAGSGSQSPSQQPSLARAGNPDLSVKTVERVDNVVATSTRHAEPVGVTPPLTDGPSPRPMMLAERQEERTVRRNANRRNAWPKIPKVAPPQVLSNAWGSDTEHDAPSFHEWDDPADAVRALVDWNGDWLPPPVQWEGRRSYRDRNVHATIEAWITKGECECKQWKKSGKCSCRTIEVSRHW